MCHCSICPHFQVLFLLKPCTGGFLCPHHQSDARAYSVLVLHKCVHYFIHHKYKCNPILRFFVGGRNIQEMCPKYTDAPLERLILQVKIFVRGRFQGSYYCGIFNVCMRIYVYEYNGNIHVLEMCTKYTDAPALT